MNKFDDLTQRSIENGHKLNIFEVALFEIYLLTIGFALCTIFPSIINKNPKIFFIYLILFIFGVTYVFYAYFRKNKNLEKRWKIRGIYIQLLKNFSYIDFAIYKITMILFAIILCYFFPDFFLKDSLTPWYTLIFGFGAGYFVSKIFVGKEKRKFSFFNK